MIFLAMTLLSTTNGGSIQMKAGSGLMIRGNHRSATSSAAYSRAVIRDSHRRGANIILWNASLSPLLNPLDGSGYGGERRRNPVYAGNAVNTCCLSS